MADRKAPRFIDRAQIKPKPPPAPPARHTCNTVDAYGAERRDEPAGRDQRLIDALHLTARHASQVSVAFVRGMAARMALSFEKYGDLRDAYPDKVDALNSLQLRLDKYAQTGNTEYLIDVANFAMIEFMRPLHRDAFFQATDADGSSGRVFQTGAVTQDANTLAGDNVRRGGSALRTAGGFYAKEGD